MFKNIKRYQYQISNLYFTCFHPENVRLGIQNIIHDDIVIFQ